MTEQAHSLQRRDDYWVGRFQAMASPCELLIDVNEETLAQEVLALAQREAKRIEHKFSRYRDDSIVHRINASAGKAVAVDDETAALLDYAEQCFALSEGMFDVTSGVLRRVWRFDGSDRIPRAADVAKLLKHVGWRKINWARPDICVPPGMEIDFGGIGKEYAVDRTTNLIREMTAASVLVNFGGDLCITTPRRDDRGWWVGIEDPSAMTTTPTVAGQQQSVQTFELVSGAIATSGDTRRYLLKDGIRYSHILDPRTGWPMRDAPHSVTVVGQTCTEAGILATLAMLHGKDAEAFLSAQGVRFWCLR